MIWRLILLCLYGTGPVWAVKSMRINHILSQTRNEVVFSVIAEADCLEDSLGFLVNYAPKRLRTKILPPCRSCRSRVWQLQVIWHPHAYDSGLIRMQFLAYDQKGDRDTLTLNAQFTNRVDLDYESGSAGDFP